jgi:hypothetical protein
MIVVTNFGQQSTIDSQNLRAEWRSVMFFNYFVCLCSCLLETLVGLTDFLVVKDLGLQLLKLISRQVNPPLGDPPQRKTLFARLFLFIDSRPAKIPMPFDRASETKAQHSNFAHMR